MAEKGKEAIVLRNLVKITPTAIARYAEQLRALGNKELVDVTRKSLDGLRLNASRAFSEGISVGLACEDAFRRWGYDGGYQKYLDVLDISKQKALRWREIARAAMGGKIPEFRDDGEEWTQANALAYLETERADAADAKRILEQPGLTPEQAALAQAKARRDRHNLGTHQALMRKATKLWAEIEQAILEGGGSSVAGVVGYLMMQSQQADKELRAQIIDAEKEES